MAQSYQGVDFVFFRGRSHSCHGGLQSDRMGDLLARSDRCSPSPRHDYDFVDFVFPIQGPILNMCDELMSFWWKLLRLCIGMTFNDELCWAVRCSPYWKNWNVRSLSTTRPIWGDDPSWWGISSRWVYSSVCHTQKIMVPAARNNFISYGKGYKVLTANIFFAS